MPAKKEFSTAEEAAEYIEFLRQETENGLKNSMTIKLKLTPKNINNFWKNARNQIMIFIIKIKIYL